MSTQEPKEETRKPLCPLFVLARSIRPDNWESESSEECIEGACAWWFQPRPIVVWNPEAELSEPKEGRGRCGVAR